MISTRVIRDTLMFLLGAGGFIHEVLVTGSERPQILLACMALMGVPVFLRRDEGKAAAVAQAVKEAVGGQESSALPAGRVEPEGPAETPGPE